jgi:hypothetical protein
MLRPVMAYTEAPLGDSPHLAAGVGPQKVLLGPWGEFLKHLLHAVIQVLDVLV